MDGDLMSFQYGGQPVRTVTIDGEPWFVAKDVCEVLGYVWKGVSGSLAHVPEEWRGVCSVQTPSGAQDMASLSEQGLYFFLGRSDKPAALPFQKWLAGEVVPSIRKTGMYAVDALLDDPDRLLQVVAKWADERKARRAAEARLVEQQPLVTFAETCLESKDCLLVREVAKVASKKGIRIGQNRLFEKLREWGLVMPKSTEPYQSAVDAGLLTVVERPVEGAYGSMLTKTTKVTPKGQVYIIERLRAEAKAGGKLPAAETGSDHPIATTQAGATRH